MNITEKINETMSTERLANLHLDLLNKTKLAWDVIQEPLITESGRRTNQIGLFRSDNDYHLGTHSERYQVCQNSELAKLLIYASSEIEELDIESMRGGNLQNGRKVYFQIPLPESSINGFETNSYLTALNSHDGTTSVAFGSTKVVVICQNTFFQAYRGKDISRVLHHSTMKAKLQSISEAIRESIIFDKQLSEVFERMTDVSVSQKDIIALQNKIFVPTTEEDSTRRMNILQKFNSAVDIEFATHGSNAWGLFNGVTRYTTHMMSLRQNSDSMTNVMVGTGAKINSLAFNHLSLYLN